MNKRNLCILLAALMLLCAGCQKTVQEPAAQEAPAEEKAAPVRSASVMEYLLTLPYARVTHSKLQGGHYDGRYYYQTNIKFDTASGQKENETYILKYDMQTGETAAISECLKLGHSNDIAWNPDTNQLLVVCNKPFYDQLGVLDPDTLEQTGTITLPVKIFCLDYEPGRKQYVAGLSGGQSFVILNEDFEVVSPEFQPTDETAGYTTQGCCCDENYIYFVLHNKSVITVYDWDGNYIKTIAFDSPGEPENISVVDGQIYVMVSRVGAAIFTVTETEAAE